MDNISNVKLVLLPHAIYLLQIIAWILVKYLLKKTSVSLQLTIKKHVRYTTWIKNLNIVQYRATNAKAQHPIQNALDAPPYKHGLVTLDVTLI